ncbi:MAG: DinB family protein [bacterium]|nr:DinB family protein [bacterium]
MHAQLQSVMEDLQRSEDELHAFAAGADEDGWNRRPGPRRWSASECVEHLNLSSEAILPEFWRAMERARSAGEATPRPLRLGLTGWLLVKGSGPGWSPRVKTRTGFEPRHHGSVGDVRDRFLALQDELRVCLRAADGLAIDQARVISPFDGRVSYNLYAGFRLVAAHQARHLRQAGEALGLR